MKSSNRVGQRIQTDAMVFTGFMQIALAEAHAAVDRGEVPVGAVIVKDNQIIARDGNRTVELKDPTAHAEMLVIRKAAAALQTERLVNCDLYVTLEPCPMCATAVSFARIRRLYYGAPDPKSGGCEHGPRIFDQPSCHHRPDVYDGISADESGALLTKFFRSLR